MTAKKKEGAQTPATSRAQEGVVRARSAGRSSRSASAGRITKVGRSDARASGPAREKSLDLTKVLSADHVTISRGREKVELPQDAVRALRRYAAALAHGGRPRLVAVTDEGATLSSQQAADMLNVSRPFVVKLARTGQLSHTKTGNRHRFALADVLDYDARARRERDDALREMVPAEGYGEADF